MAYDPADLRLPPWLTSALDAIVRLRIPLGSGWHLGVTRPGAIFAATMVGVTAAAAYSGNNLLYLCAGMLLSMGVLALVSGFLVLRSIPDVSACMPDVSISGCVHVLRRELQVRTWFPADVHGRWESEGHAVDFRLRCSDKTFLQGRLPVPRRGLMRFTKLFVSTEAPLGLWHLQRRVENMEWTWAAVPASAALPVNPETSLPDGGEWHDLRKG